MDEFPRDPKVTYKRHFDVYGISIGKSLRWFHDAHRTPRRIESLKGSGSGVPCEGVLRGVFEDAFPAEGRCSHRNYPTTRFAISLALLPSY